MDESEIFTIEQDGVTLIVALPKTEITFADDQINAGVHGILELLRKDSLSNLVVDFGQSPYFGSIVLGAVLTLQNAIHEKKGRFAICNLSTVGQEIIRISRFDSVWPIFETRQEALVSVNP